MKNGYIKRFYIQFIYRDEILVRYLKRITIGVEIENSLGKIIECREVKSFFVGIIYAQRNSKLNKIIIIELKIKDKHACILNTYVLRCVM